MTNDAGAHRRPDRRTFLQVAVAAVAVRMASRYGVGSHRTVGRGLQPPAFTPDAAVAELLAGNRRYAGNQLTSFHQSLSNLRARTAAKQEPFAGVLACADSRVPVELLFDQSIGRLFVTRLAGNIATPEIIASLEYGVAVLGIHAILVLGHSDCGAVKAAIEANTVPGQISALYPHLRRAVEQSGGLLGKAVQANTRLQADLLRTSSTVIRDATAAGTLKVVAGVYDLATGKVALA